MVEIIAQEKKRITKRVDKKTEFKQYLLESLQEDYAFRQQIYTVLLDILPVVQPFRRRTKAEWRVLSAQNSIQWKDIQALQDLFKESD